MGGAPARTSLVFLVLLCLILVGLSLTAGGCDTQAGGVKQTVQAYYDGIARGDRQAEMSLWMSDRQNEAAREADAWSRRDRDGLKLDEVHVDSGPADDQRLVHITISIDDKARPGKRRYETKVLLVQQSGDSWRIRDVR